MDDDDDVVMVEGGLVFMSKLFVLQVFSVSFIVSKTHETLG